MASRARDWFRQAERDLAHARRSTEGGDHEWACFAAQQAAEKALKAVLQDRGADARGHSVSAILEALSAGMAETVEMDLKSDARELDRHYILTRYPNSVPEGAPFEAYDEKDAERAVAAADRILRFCQRHMAGS